MLKPNHLNNCSHHDSDSILLTDFEKTNRRVRTNDQTGDEEEEG